MKKRHIVWISISILVCITLIYLANLMYRLRPGDRGLKNFQGYTVSGPFMVCEIEPWETVSILGVDLATLRLLKPPLGGCNNRWQEMKKMRRKGDVLYFFRSPPDTWQSLCGREGYVLIRDEEVVFTLITTIN